MLIKLLRTTMYDEMGLAWRTEDVQNPTWEAIEAAIQRLDRFRYPFFWLFRELDVAADDVPDFTVIGGEGVFAIDCRANDTDYRYFDPTRGDGEIVVWRSDQGAAFEEKYCCFSTATVLQATRFYCEHGAPDLSFTWESNSLPDSD
jgi:hypothetical protein